MEGPEVSAQSGTEQARPETGPARDCLSFRLRDEEYGIDLLCVREIRTYEKPNWIAGAPVFIPGVLNMRGEIVPIVDLRLRFGLNARFDPNTVTVVVDVAGRTIGIVVDSVSDVLQLAPEQIRAAPDFCGAVAAQFVTQLGLVRQDGRERMLILLDIEQLLTGADAGLATESVNCHNTSTGHLT
jgi:purine-binding chemotaxis protein CheW